ncbi:MAG: hypothetical protein H7831_00920 [Magnetococcus sp. WYHC-3]
MMTRHSFEPVDSRDVQGDPIVALLMQSSREELRGLIRNSGSEVPWNDLAGRLLAARQRYSDHARTLDLVLQRLTETLHEPRV